MAQTVIEFQKEATQETAQKEIKKEVEALKTDNQHLEDPLSDILTRHYYLPILYQDVIIEPGFFKVEKDKEVIYLLGTHHQLPLSVLPLPYLEVIKGCVKSLLNVFQKDKLLKKIL